MDPHSACPDTAVDHKARLIWNDLATSGAAVPLDPMDLDLMHLLRAEAQGVDVRAVLATPRSGPSSAA